MTASPPPKTGEGSTSLQRRRVFTTRAWWRSAGGLWLVDADGPDSVMALVQADPFWPTGLRKDVRVLEWKQVFVRA